MARLDSEEGFLFGYFAFAEKGAKVEFESGSGPKDNFTLFF